MFYDNILNKNQYRKCSLDTNKITNEPKLTSPLKFNKLKPNNSFSINDNELGQEANADSDLSNRRSQFSNRSQSTAAWPSVLSSNKENRNFIRNFNMSKLDENNDNEKNASEHPQFNKSYDDLN